MSKRYKHKRSGLIATEQIVHTNTYKGNTTERQYFLDTYGILPPYAVELSRDWAEIKEPLFELATDDGIAHAIDEVVYYVHDNGIVYENTAGHWFMFKEMKVFINKENAEKYSESCKPKILVTTYDGVAITIGSTLLYVVNTKGNVSVVEARHLINNREQFGRVYASHDLAHAYAATLNLPKVLFTTQDGIDITDGKTVLYGLNTPPFSNSWATWEQILIELNTSAKSHSGVKLFSSEAKRDEYILMNKPLLSLGEVDSIIKLDMGKNAYRYIALKSKLESLAKSKL